MRKSFFVVVIGLFLCFLSSFPVKISLADQERNPPKTPRLIYEKAQGYVVNLYSDHGSFKGSGTGFFIKYNDRIYIVTAAHVVTMELEVFVIQGEQAFRRLVTVPASNIRFALNNRLPPQEAELVGFDVWADIAILKPKDKNFEPSGFAVLGDSDDLSPGASLASVCSQMGINFSLAVGWIMQINLNDTSFVNAIVSDVPINSGCSGGPVMNSRGEAVGINLGIAGRNFSFHVPINHLKVLLPRLIKGEVKNADMAVAVANSWELDADVYRKLGISRPRKQGAIILDVIPKSLAELGGLRKGDVILSWNDKEVSGIVDFVRFLLLDGVPDEIVKIKVLRGDRELTLKVKLEERIAQEEVQLPYNKK